TLGHTIAVTDTLDRVTQLRYNSLGQLVGQQDWRNRWLSQQYDQLGRVVTTVQNCTGAQAPLSCAGQTADTNVSTWTGYDLLGRVYRPTNALSRPTLPRFEGLGGVTASIQSYSDGIYSPASPDIDVIDQTVDNALGQTVAMTDTLGAVTTMQ